MVLGQVYGQLALVVSAKAFAPMVTFTLSPATVLTFTESGIMAKL